jgi:nucleoside-diphosphate-sugar epimerase
VAELMITIVGGTGFVGTHLVSELNSNNITFQLLNRKEELPVGKDLGTLVYCAGFGGCEQDPFNVLNANAILLGQLLNECKIEKVIYVSSTRLYLDDSSSVENRDLHISATDSRRLFNLTKIVAEELILKSNIPYVILRSSNIYGDAFESPLFLPSIVRDALIRQEVKMYISPEYAKDYVSVFDLVKVILISLDSKKAENKIVNIAAGENISAKEIAQTLVTETACKVSWCGNMADDFFPTTDISLMKKVFKITPRKVLDDLPLMVKSFKKKLK